MKLYKFKNDYQIIAVMILMLLPFSAPLLPVLALILFRNDHTLDQTGNMPGGAPGATI